MGKLLSFFIAASAKTESDGRKLLRTGSGYTAGTIPGHQRYEGGLTRNTQRRAPKHAVRGGNTWYGNGNTRFEGTYARNARARVQEPAVQATRVTANDCATGKFGRRLMLYKAGLCPRAAEICYNSAVDKNAFKACELGWSCGFTNIKEFEKFRGSIDANVIGVLRCIKAENEGVMPENNVSIDNDIMSMRDMYVLRNKKCINALNSNLPREKKRRVGNKSLIWINFDVSHFKQFDPPGQCYYNEEKNFDHLHTTRPEANRYWKSHHYN